MKDIVVIKIAGTLSQEEYSKISEQLNNVFEGTNQKPLLIWGDTEVYMMKEESIIDFLPDELREFIRDQKLKRLGI